MTQHRATVERNRVARRSERTVAVNRAAVNRLAVEPHGRRARHQQIAGYPGVAVQRDTLGQQHLHRAVEPAVQHRRVPHQGGDRHHQRIAH